MMNGRRGGDADAIEIGDHREQEREAQHSRADARRASSCLGRDDHAAIAQRLQALDVRESGLLSSRSRISPAP